MTGCEHSVRDNAKALNLCFRQSSGEAEDLVLSTVKAIAQRKRGKSGRIDRGLIVATGAIIADLLLSATKDRSSYRYRRMSRESFSGEPIGYRPFKRAIDGLRTAGMIEVLVGTGGGSEIGIATRLRATEALVSRAESHGVTLADWSVHFRALPRLRSIPNPLVLKSSSVVARGEKRPGLPLSVDLGDAKAEAVARQVNELNAFFAGVEICPDYKHYAFQRVFNQGDTSEFDWNKGGRLISMGDSYQQLPRIERKEMKLNGEAVVEIDIRASHLTILHALLKKPFDPHRADPYEVDGVPREVVKAWVTMTLGYDRFQTRWSRTAKEKYLKTHGHELQKVFPIKEVRVKVLDRLPALKNWESCRYRWGDLQFVESCAIVDTVHKLATDYAIPALPVHDSIIVPQHQKVIAEEVLSACFEKHVGVKPAMTIA